MKWVNRNKYEKFKGLWLQKKNNVIEFNKELSLFICPTAGCSTTSKYKNNIVKNLKLCFAINQQRNSVADNKTCHYYYYCFYFYSFHESGFLSHI